MPTPTDCLVENLRHTLGLAAPAPLCVAFSGGPDSTALLYALAQLPQARARGLRALHVDHGLHADSKAWAKRCADFCESVGVPLATVRVQVDDTRGEGIEAAARRARYAAFAGELREGEWLVLAHHRDDQVETVLLKLLRGAGPEGLGGMRALRPFARGMLWRPLLETPRSVLQDCLRDARITALDDPANADPRLARNVVRHEVVPLLARHWPHFDAAVLHTAELARASADFVASEAAIALAGCMDADHTVAVAEWLALPPPLRASALDQWLRAHALPAPPDAARAELERQARTAGADSMPCVAWAGAQVRIWDARLYATPPLPAVPAEWSIAWNGGAIDLPGDGGALELVPSADRPPRGHGRPDLPPLTVRLRRGGEHIQPAGDAHARELRDLFQQSRVPPWLRARCPLVYSDGVLLAVADLWLSERGANLFAQCGVTPKWQRPTWA